MATRQESVLRIRVGPPSVGILSILVATLLAAGPLFVSLLLRKEVVAEFEHLHRSFGANVPAGSRLLLEYAGQAGWIMIGVAAVQLVLLVMMSFQRTTITKRRYFRVAIPGFLIALALLALLYAPMVSLGAVV